MKRVAVIEQDVALGTQIQVLNFPSVGKNNVYEMLHSFIHNAVSPLYDSYLFGKQKETERDDKDSRMGNCFIEPFNVVAKKKIAELELSLLNLQQNVEIPEVRLIFNPAILKAIQKVIRPLNPVNAVCLIE